MFGFKKCSECKEVPKTFDEYNLKLENERIKLHMRYISCIAIAIIVWMIATKTASHPKFPEWVSFAGTITSIILSVLAIILSITGEGKTEHIKEQIEMTAKELDKTVVSIAGINEGIESNINQLNASLSDLQSKIDDLPGKTAEETAKKMGTMTGKDAYTPHRTNMKNKITNKDWRVDTNGK